MLIGGDVIELVKNAFAYCFKGARLSTTVGSDIEHINYVGQVSIIIRTLTNKDGDLLSHFDEIDETQAQIKNTSLKFTLVNNHDIAEIKSRTK